MDQKRKKDKRHWELRLLICCKSQRSFQLNDRETEFKLPL